jgi:hypothetical protein
VLEAGGEGGLLVVEPYCSVGARLESKQEEVEALLVIAFGDICRKRETQASDAYEKKIVCEQLPCRRKKERKRASKRMKSSSTRPSNVGNGMDMRDSRNRKESSVERV